MLSIASVRNRAIVQSPPQPVKQQAIVENVDERSAKLLMLAQGYSAAQLVAHRLHAVANPEHRDPKPEGDFGRSRRVARGHRSGAAGQDDRTRRELTKPGIGDRIGVDLAVNPALADPPRDQLGHLAAEIDDQDAVGHGWRSNM